MVNPAQKGGTSRRKTACGAITGLDLGVLRAYLANMARRLILALLTLLTGLAALAGPAHARVATARGSEVGAVASIVVQPERTAAIRVIAIPGKVRRVVVIRPLFLAAPDPVRAARTVMTGIDRSRE